MQFKTAALTLTVPPRITASGTVILEVDVDNGSRGTVQANGNISINTQRVQTTVLVKDQGTTVIGGIYETLETNNRGPDARSVAGAVHRQPLQANTLDHERGRTAGLHHAADPQEHRGGGGRTNPVNGAGK